MANGNKDVEEGEISSDSGSVEEISREDFKPEPNKDKSKSKQQQGGVAEQQQARPWTMEELYKAYPGYARRLYNYAWSQAVQNKPLNEGFERESSTASTGGCGEGSKEVEKIVIDDSGDDDEMNGKEEGELEEGEFRSGSEEELVENQGDGVLSCGDAMMVEGVDFVVDSVNVGKLEGGFDEGRVKSVRDALESVTEAKVEKSFQEVCGCIQSALESLHELVSNNNGSTIEGLDQLVLSAIRVVNSVLYSMDSNKKQQKDIFIRLLSYVKRCDPPLLSLKQLNEIELMLLSWKSISCLFSGSASEKQLGVELAASPAALSDANMSLEALKPGLLSLKVRGGLPPLLDLHKDHDVDSLPSPTREAPLQLPIGKSMPTGDASKMVHPGFINSKEGRNSEDLTLQFYGTDAFRAFSSYQQKFGQNSFFVSDKLPSPTPSEEASIGDAKISGEVSSLPLSTSNKPGPPILNQEVVHSTPFLDKTSGQELNDSRNAVPTTLGPKATSRGPRKVNDPRLQFASSNKAALDLNQGLLHGVHNAAMADPTGEIGSLKKHKTNEEPSDSPALKRQRNGFENPMADNNSKIASCNSRLEETKAVTPTFTSKEQFTENAEPGLMDMDIEISRSKPGLECVSGTGGWLEETVDIPTKSMNKAWPLEDGNEKDKAVQRKLNNGIMNLTSCGSPNVGTSGQPSPTVSGNAQLPVLGFGTTASLPALLNDIAVNPSIFINLFTSIPQGMGSEPQHSAACSSIGTATSSLNPLLGAVSAGNLPPSISAGLMQKPSGTLSASSQSTPLGDSGKMRMKPRDPRRALHVNAFQKSGPPTTNNQEAKESILTPKLGAQVDMKPQSSQSGQQPNRTQQSTKNLKNIADMVFSHEVSSSSSQPGTNSDKEITRPAVLRTSEQQSRTSSAPELGVVGSWSQNTWADVEHLLEGYNEQQKAAIQTERARRIGEQKKMFAARKLCLVLDLDHTLLNSAKFSEIDPMHEEILRKKEEQDREKPQRHLFRFSHMGMWTKLRPGVWKFLERASQLFELHLYTMGNKVYATEMAKVLDPKGTLFAGRVISRGDDGDLSDGEERVPRSKDLEGVLGMESAVLIIDDSIKVWPHNKPNLIVVERYTYFPCSRRQFGLLGPSLLEIDHDERPEDGTLASSLAVVERIHQSFFSHPSLDDVDVRTILAEEQRKILAGCCIVFSRVFPNTLAKPHLHPLWQTAEQFGAICISEQKDYVTHVVASTLGTDKANWALSSGRFLVNPGWVEASALLYRRANEADFVVK